MYLVDTSVWVSHFRCKNKRLDSLLCQELVYCHPLIIGELACGHLHHRNEILHLMRQLPVSVQATDQEIFSFIEKHQLMGQGLGIVDVHLLASAFLSGLWIWTEDKRMHQIAYHLNLIH